MPAFLFALGFPATSHRLYSSKPQIVEPNAICRKTASYLYFSVGIAVEWLPFPVTFGKATDHVRIVAIGDSATTH